MTAFTVVPPVDKSLGVNPLFRKIRLHAETAVPVKKGCWSVGLEEHEISFEAFLVNDSSGVERGGLPVNQTEPLKNPLRIPDFR
jgi:hypothetical protein